MVLSECCLRRVVAQVLRFHVQVYAFLGAILPRTEAFGEVVVFLIGPRQGLAVIDLDVELELLAQLGERRARVRGQDRLWNGDIGAGQ